ncbi:Periplasmic molybdate-binding protein/domain [hydrothermal vent metagenome]|uniref:Periplasmic molybdate-binding protein/domain n=1 Tax=hydrothermal vent metagenome TaxID=652676 RepID=A0A3B0TJ64_9ZZZZ
MTTPQRDYLTTRELAELLRVKERKIYDLAAAGEVPCRRITGKLLFPRQEIEAWIGGNAGATAKPDPAPIVAGSHDPLLDWALREAGTGLGGFFDGSLDGIERLADGGAVMTGMHVFEGPAGWNLGLVRDRFAGRPLVVLRWAKRRQGLIVPQGSDIARVVDLKGRLVSLRQATAGSRLLFDHFSAQAGLGLGDFSILGEVRTETEAATDVASGRADAAFGLEAVARQYDLGFVPLIEEEFDLLVQQKAYFLPACQSLWAFCRSRRFTEKATEFGGYDVSGLGEVRWVGS